MCVQPASSLLPVCLQLASSLPPACLQAASSLRPACLEGGRLSGGAVGGGQALARFAQKLCWRHRRPGSQRALRQPKWLSLASSGSGQGEIRVGSSQDWARSGC